ncbi:epoxide hydrolase [Arenicella chitinivorans]|uniref:Epoxide hydrolase n=1 Tax=Arenicella chitinivorans TaxID=1329800 RepID=A0A918VLQ7_9GAMM|nr:epoxide hydrolase [Arenicella chitinivorans]
MRDLHGKSIFTIDEGSEFDTAVVLIHGFPTSSMDWEPIWPALSRQFRTVTLDMWGFGFSDKPNTRCYSIHQQADLFEALISELGIHRYHVIAHDYGVSVAQELLARHTPSHTSQWLSLCLLNGGLFPEAHHPILIQKLMLSPLGKYINYLTGFKQFSKSFSSVFGAGSQPSEQELQEFWEAINFNEGRHVFHNLITYMNDRRTHRERWVSALQNAPVPIALINGSVDPVSGAHLVKRYKELDCRLDYLAELPTTGHYPQVEAPQTVLDAYQSFLSELGASKETITRPLA